MLENMIKYQNRIEKLLDENPSGTDWEEELEFFKTKLLHFQIERVIHLLVTLTVGFAALLSCCVTFIYKSGLFGILDVIFIILFFAYILHYRKLENTTQSMYPTLDKIKEKI
jgi:hypothetical protein